MTIYLKQNTASQEVPFGYFVDDTDGKTAETALTIANTDIKLWKNGATALANKNSGGATHMAGGIYYAVLDATDTDTLGPLVIYIAVAGALPVKLECLVMTAAAYDVLTAATGDAYARLGAPSGASISADIQARTLASASYATAANQATIASYIDTEVAAIKAVTDAIPNAGAMTSIATAASIAALNNLSAAQVNAEVVDALAVDAYAEPGAVPAATASLKDKIGWLFALARNKVTQTSTTQTLRNDGDSGSIATATCADDGTTMTRAKWS